MTETRVEHPGPAALVALVVRVLEAARADHRGGCAPESCGGSGLDPCRLANALEALDRGLEEEAREMGTETAGHWHPATWRDTRAGDRIRLGGQHEATVEMAIPMTWVARGATQIQVKLEGRPAPYTMPPTGPVEVWTPSLPEWAADALRILERAGLGAEVISHG